MTRISIILAIFFLPGMLFFSNLAEAGGTLRPVESSIVLKKFAKSVSLVSQLTAKDKGLIGNGIIVGEKGCHVLTNFHMAFGESADVNGEINFIDDDLIDIGHRVRISVDYNDETGMFERSIPATVIETGDYGPENDLGRSQDWTLLRLDDCLGEGYGIVDFEQDADKKFEPTDITAVSMVMFTDVNGKYGLYADENCPVFPKGLKTADGQRSFEGKSVFALYSGLIYSQCKTKPGTSGSMVLGHGKDGKIRLIGIHRGEIGYGKVGPIAIAEAVYARSFNPALVRALGEVPFTSGHRNFKRPPQRPG